MRDELKDALVGLVAVVVVPVVIASAAYLALTQDDNNAIREVDTTTTTIASQCVAPGWRAIPVPGGWTGIEDPRCK